MGLEEGAEVAAHEMGHAYVQHAPVKRASHVQSYVQVLLHGGNTAGLAYSIMICPDLACPALPYCALLICVVPSRLSCTNRAQQGFEPAARGRDKELDSDWKAGVGRIWRWLGRRTDEAQRQGSVQVESGVERCCRCSSPVVRCGRLHELGVTVRTVSCVLFL